MTWIYYILIFWLVCIAISMWLRFRKKEDRETTLSQVLLIAVASPIVLLGIIVLKVGTFIENKVNEKKRKEKEQEELEDLSLTIAKKREQEKRKRENIKKMFSEDDTRF